MPKNLTCGVTSGTFPHWTSPCRAHFLGPGRVILAPDTRLRRPNVSRLTVLADRAFTLRGSGKPRAQRRRVRVAAECTRNRSSSAAP
jgi:hypothetical protein